MGFFDDVRQVLVAGGALGRAPPMSNELEASMTVDGNKAKVVVEATNKDSSFLNFMNVERQRRRAGSFTKPQQVRLVQTGPGRYEADIDANDPGAYVAVINYRGAKANQQGMTLAGTVVNTSPELRELKSNDSLLAQVADRTGGRVLPPFDPAAANLFTREGLYENASPLPIWDILIPILLAPDDYRCRDPQDRVGLGQHQAHGGERS